MPAKTYTLLYVIRPSYTYNIVLEKDCRNNRLSVELLRAHRVPLFLHVYFGLRARIYTQGKRHYYVASITAMMNERAGS